MSISEKDVREWLEENTIAYKWWTEDDLASCLKKKGFKPSAENVAEVLGEGLHGLDDSTDGDLEIIFQAIARASRRLQRRPNIGQATTQSINGHYNVGTWVLDTNAVLNDLLAEYDREEVGAMLKNFVKEHPNDGRISPANKNWAKGAGYPSVERDTDPTWYGAHPGLVDLLVTAYREQDDAIKWIVNMCR